jgi:hypothetical protein
MLEADIELVGKDFADSQATDAASEPGHEEGSDAEATPSLRKPNIYKSSIGGSRRCEDRLGWVGGTLSHASLHLISLCYPRSKSCILRMLSASLGKFSYLVRFVRTPYHRSDARTFGCCSQMIY